MSIQEFLVKNEELYFSDNLFVQKKLNLLSSFESLYLKLREKENRLYSADEIRLLPEIHSSHPLKSEWAIRKKSSNLLLQYLQTNNSFKKILEVGCGNGWLSSLLAHNSASEVCGIDVNEFELRQASRIINESSNLHYVLGSVWDPTLPAGAFDVIILASSIQYFPDVAKLLRRLFELVSTEGEIHILDSPFYKSIAEAEHAADRSRLYFESMGFPLMAEHYFHPTFEQLKEFDLQMMHTPYSLFSGIRRRLLRSTSSPFPWIRVKRK